MADIVKDIEFYDSIKSNLEATHLSKWVLIHNQKFINTYENFDKAVEDAVKLFGRGPYLIRQIGAPPVVLPTSVAFIIGRHA
jgi:hypothetical protein